ncbi:hypothetical protein AMK22_32230 [Streptomyces sp. CB01580]|nr:hypothetical protein AMK22_32230 [Streptomyces sp. CB01580]
MAGGHTVSTSAPPDSVTWAEQETGAPARLPWRDTAGVEPMMTTHEVRRSAVLVTGDAARSGRLPGMEHDGCHHLLGLLVTCGK